MYLRNYHILLSVIFVGLLGCDSRGLKLNFKSSSTLSGKIDLSSSSSLKAGSVKLCSSYKVSIYLIDENGVQSTSPIAETDTKSDGSYTFTGIVDKGIENRNQKLLNSYIIEAAGCNEIYSRVATGVADQNISVASTFMSFLLGTNIRSYFTNVVKEHPELVGSFIESINGASSFQEAYGLIDSADELQQKFLEAFNNEYTLLEAAAPRIQNILVQKSIPENNPTIFSVTAEHWKNDYTEAFQWKWDNVVVSNAATYSKIPGKNEQGEHVLKLLVGRDDGGGLVDLTKPYHQKEFKINVANTFKPVVPGVSLISDNVTNNSSVTLQVATGVGLVNCDTFSRLAISENSSEKPEESEFIYSCSAAGTQNIAYGLQNLSNGIKELKLWAMDGSGLIGNTPQGVSLTYDTQAPVVTSVLIANGASNIGSISAVVKVSVSDNGNVTHVKLSNSNPGNDDCQSQYSNTNWRTYGGGVQSYSHTVDSGDGIKKVCVWAKDASGNVSVISPSLGTLGQNMDTVIYEVGTPPVVTSFNVNNNTAGLNFGTTTFDIGDQLNISWTVTDAEGLKDGPVSIYYTTDNNTWSPVVTDHGPASPGTTYSDTYLTFTAPVSTFMRLKIVVTDIANNNNVETTSDALNSGSWSVYAGTSSDGVGGSYNSVQIKKATYGVHSGQMAINPLNNDTYYLSHQKGIVRSNTITGKTEYLIKHGTSNMNGATTTIDASTRVQTAEALIKFDKEGNLYLKDNDSFFRIDVETLSVKKLFGGGTNHTSPYTAADVDVFKQTSFDIDLNKNIYFFADCEEATGTWAVNNNNTTKIIKATYNSGSDDYSFTDYAGNCTLENPTTGGVPSLAQGIGMFKHKHLISLSVNGDGSMVYYGEDTKYKIVNGKSFSSIVGHKGVSINKNDDTVYSANKEIYKYINAKVEADNSETSSLYIGITGGAGCNADGTPIASACINAYHGNGLGHIYVGYSSDVYFLDIGPRVRFVSNSNNKIYTALGSKALYGEGLNKQFLRAQDMGGIYYKKSSEPNQVLFPEGLYFTDKYSMTINYIHPSTGIVSVVAGDQSILGASAAGSTFNSSVSLGSQHSSINLVGLDFDSNGLPWFIADRKIRTVNSSNQLVNKQTGGSTWSLALQDDDPANVISHYRMGSGNLEVSGDGVFAIGNGASGNALVKGAVIQYHNYGTSAIEHLMGGAVLPTQGYSADSAGPGSTSALTISSTCNGESCFVRYHSGSDILYFAEDSKIRYITSPKDATLSTLGTLFDAGRNVRNFVFTENGEQIYYVSSNGLLYCYDLPGGSSPAHCDNTSLGPNIGFESILSEGSQLTWKSATELIINNNRSEIYMYKVPL